MLWGAAWGSPVQAFTGLGELQLHGCPQVLHFGSEYCSYSTMIQDLKQSYQTEGICMHWAFLNTRWAACCLIYAVFALGAERMYEL